MLAVCNKCGKVGGTYLWREMNYDFLICVGTVLESNSVKEL